jgi:hypothetical protein
MQKKTIFYSKPKTNKNQCQSIYFTIEQEGLVIFGEEPPLSTRNGKIEH